MTIANHKKQDKPNGQDHDHVISLRKLSDDLYWRIKLSAAKAHQGVEEYIVTLLEDATSQAR